MCYRYQILYMLIYIYNCLIFKKQEYRVHLSIRENRQAKKKKKIYKILCLYKNSNFIFVLEIYVQIN